MLNNVNIPTGWLDRDDKLTPEELQVILFSSKTILQHLSKVISRKKNTHLKKILSIDYSTPTVPEQIAHEVGYCKALDELLKLTDIFKVDHDRADTRANANRDTDPNL